MKNAKLYRERFNKLAYRSEIVSLWAGLDLQKERIMETKILPMKARPTHDAYYYMILANKLYREIHINKRDSRVGRLKGKYKDLFNKIKIRQDFEHSEKINAGQLMKGEGKLPSGYKPTKQILEVTNVYLGKRNFIRSGDKEWDLDRDHALLAKAMEELVNLYPFELRSMKKGLFATLYECSKKTVKYFRKCVASSREL